MNNSKRSVIAALAICLGLLLVACGSDNDSEGEQGEQESTGDGEAGTRSAEGDEESGIQYTKDEAYDESRRGARLVLRYDASRDAFVGTVTNTTDAVLDQVRVEVHLSSGVELGPTTPGDLQPGQSTEISLSADGEQFDTWSAHPESGRNEGGAESSGEHGGEESEGEHGADTEDRE